jgi:hypothetical protein
VHETPTILQEGQRTSCVLQQLRPHRPASLGGTSAHHTPDAGIAHGTASAALLYGSAYGGRRGGAGAWNWLHFLEAANRSRSRTSSLINGRSKA